MATEALGGLKIALTTLTSALSATPIPGASLIPQLALQVIGIAESVKKNKQDARDLAAYIAHLVEAITRPLQDKRPSECTQEMLEQISVLQAEIDRVKTDMEKLVSRTSWRCWIGYSDDTMKISGFTARIQTVLSVFQLDANLKLLIQVGQIKDGLAEHEIQRFIDRLGTGDNGASDVAMDDKERTCLDGTRKPVLDRLRRWIEDMSLGFTRIFWLTGVAGSGKSTVAATIVLREAAYKRLATGFYFSRAQPDRNKRVFLELARRLASWRGGLLRSTIAQAVTEEPDIAYSTPANQFEKLIRQPLQALPSSVTTALIVLDALDECEEKLASKIVELIDNSHLTLPTAVRFLITSRAERHLKDAFGSPTLKQALTRHSLDAEDPLLVANDIEAVIKERLPLLVRPLLDDSSDWPGPERRKMLVKQSNGLFIWIMTAILFITDPNIDDPEAQVSLILSMYTGLDSLYTTVLVRAFPPETHPSLQSLLLDVLGVIVTAQVPVNIPIIASLLDPETPMGSVNIRGVIKIISRLQSVLVIPSGTDSTTSMDPIRIIHPSFADYITNSARCGPKFFIDVDLKHKQLARGALLRMRDLRRDICVINDSSKLNAEVDDLDDRMQIHAPSGLLYACQHWVGHLCRTPVDDAEDVYSLVRELLEQRLLYWMELMSLLSLAREIPFLLEQVHGWLEKFGRGSADLASLLNLTQDARRFSLEFMTVINTYGELAIKTVKVVRGLDDTWSNCLWIGEGHKRGVESLACSPDSKVIASGSWDSTLRLWNIATGTTIGQPIQGHTGSIQCLAFSPDSQVIASGSKDSTVRLWDVATRTAIGQPLRGHSNWVNCLAFSPDGKAIVSGSSDNTLRLWDASTGTPTGEPLRGHARSVLCLAFSPDGNLIASGSHDHTLGLWNVATSVEVGQPLESHSEQVCCVAFSPDSKLIVSGSWDNTLQLWDATTGGTAVGEPLQGHTSQVNCLAFSPDGNVIASSSSDNTLRLWDARTGTAIRQPLAGHIDGVFCLAFSSDGKVIASGSSDNTLRLWDVATGTAKGGPLAGHTDGANCLAFSPDGKVIVSGSSDNTLRLWDATTGSVNGAPLSDHTNSVPCIAFSPDGKVIASGSYDHTLRLWDAATGAPVGEPLRGHTDGVYRVAFSPDGKVIASGSDDGTLRLWDAANRTAIGQPLRGHASWVNCLAFSWDGKVVASGSGDCTVQLWDVATGAAHGKSLSGHTAAVTCLAFSLDGKVMASGSDDCTVRLWDTATGTTLGQPLLGHSKTPDSLHLLGHEVVISRAGSAEVMSWDINTHNRLPQSQEPVSSPVVLDSFGWIRNGHNQRLFWVPAALRSPGAPVISGNRLAITNPRVPILDISHFIAHGLL